eukprot:g2113.t1
MSKTVARREHPHIHTSGRTLDEASFSPGEDQFVFYRGPRRGKESVYVFTNNLPMTTKKVIYRDSLPKPLAGYAWKDLFSAQKIQRLSNGAVVAHSSKPLVLVMKPSKAATLAQQITS